MILPAGVTKGAGLLEALGDRGLRCTVQSRSAPITTTACWMSARSGGRLWLNRAGQVVPGRADQRTVFWNPRRHRWAMRAGRSAGVACGVADLAEIPVWQDAHAAGWLCVVACSAQPA